jgi:hypothetical protein|tara:strand:- start:2868 stop:3002 length:135 start_codon:yes stop_codon:yes gene_type:complete
MHHYRYSLSDIESLMPWEREVYLSLLVSHLENEKEKRKQQEQRR